jgi:hypothetical protein
LDRTPEEVEESWAAAAEMNEITPWVQVPEAAMRIQAALV